jgi:hypothetical protein
MDRVHHLVGLVDAVGGGQPDLDPLLEGERTPRAAHVGLGHLELTALSRTRREKPAAWRLPDGKQ